MAVPFLGKPVSLILQLVQRDLFLGTQKQIGLSGKASVVRRRYPGLTASHNRINYLQMTLVVNEGIASALS